MYPHTDSYSDQQPTQERLKSTPEVSPRTLWSFEKTLRELKAKASAEREKHRISYDLLLWRGLGAPPLSIEFCEALEVTKQMRELLE